MWRRAAIALGLLLAIGVARSAGAATLDFTGTLSVKIASTPTLPPLVIPGGGSAQLTDDGSFHLLSLLLPGGAFGPVTTTLPITANGSLFTLQFTGIENLSGSFAAISGGPPGGGSMGLQGLAKICLPFATCDFTYVPLPLTPSVGGAGFGVGGTRIASSAAVNVTLQDAPWTIGQPVMTFHTPGSNVWTSTFPGGFAHGPASLTSSTAQPSGALQLVTVTKVFTSLTGAFPELPLIGVLTLHFVPEPGTLLLLSLGAAGLALYAHRKDGR